MTVRTRDECGCSLAAEVLEQNGTVRVRVSGQSMLPTLWPGDVLTIQTRQLAEVQPGDLVLYERRGKFFVHRFALRPRENSFVTRGDCMAQSDPPIPREQFLGIVTGIARGNAVFVPSRNRSLANRISATILCEFGLLQRLVLRFHSFPSTNKQSVPTLRAVRDGGE